MIWNNSNFDDFIFDEFFEPEAPAMPNCPWKRFSYLWNEIVDHLIATAPTHADAVNRAEHTLDVARIVHRFAKAEGWCRRMRNTAIIAALLHDLHKFDTYSYHELAAAEFVRSHRRWLDSCIPYGEKVKWTKAAFAIELHAGAWKYGLREMLEKDDFDAFEIAVLLRIADKLAHGGSRAWKAWDVLKDADAVLKRSRRIFPFFGNWMLHPFSQLVRSELIFSA